MVQRSRELLILDLRFCSLEWTADGACTIFPDDARWPALPHDTPHYHYLAYRYGENGDTLAYCRHHELCHHLIAEAFGSHSLVLWALAHGEQPSAMVSAAEEALAMTLHRYSRTGEEPMIENVDWPSLKSRFLELTEAP